MTLLVPGGEPTSRSCCPSRRNVLSEFSSFPRANVAVAVAVTVAVAAMKHDATVMVSLNLDIGFILSAGRAEPETVAPSVYWWAIA